MKLVQDGKILKWLQNQWDGKMQWDENNVQKMSKHQITPEKLETILEKEIVFLGKIEPIEDVNWHEDRHLILGFVHDDKGFAVIFTKREDFLRPICCRRMRKNETKRYKESEEKFKIKKAGAG